MSGGEIVVASVLTPPEIAETRVRVPNVSWATYEHLLADLADCSAPRLTYDRGELEIMGPSLKHEKINRAIQTLVTILAEEMKIVIVSLGSMTFKREDIEGGFEPDSCFYVQNEIRIRDKEQLDLMVDPPPDLVFEVDIAHSTIDKQSLFARFGIPEVWRYDGSKIHILCLAAGSYIASERSLIFPPFTAGVLTDFIDDHLKLTSVEWMARIREWSRQQASDVSQVIQ